MNVPKSGSELSTERTPSSDVARPKSSSSCRELALHGNRSPKHITTSDEKYVLSRLECLRNCALRATTSNFASKVHISPEDFTNLPETANIGSNDMSKQSVVDILNIPLFKKLDFGRRNLREHVRSDFLNSPHKKGVVVVDPKIYVLAPRHRRVVSTSSTNTSCSDKSSSSATSFQGMLQCTWKDGLPQYVFSIDDRTEVYIANLSKDDPSNDKVLDYKYTFRIRRKELESQSLGTMRVSTSIALCSNNSSEVRETRFVLSLSRDDPMYEFRISNHNRRKSKYRPPRSRFWGSSAILEDSPSEPCEDLVKSVETKVEKDYHGLNRESAAIVVKETFKNRMEDDLGGGWGLKFLRKSGKDVSLKTILPSGCTRSYGECSTSLNVLIPAGVHSGPKTTVGGPSSLVERWISGGRCDCGGWDMGCPLTVLDTGSSGPNSPDVADNSGECQSLDLFMQGSKQDIPVFKMTNIRGGLYYIQFQSTLSTLQSFAIAAAIVHSRSPFLRSEAYRT
ncbi:hypothetical protein OROMI_032762 [Orobanche minor]